MVLVLVHATPNISERAQALYHQLEVSAQDNVAHFLQQRGQCGLKETREFLHQAQARSPNVLELRAELADLVKVATNNFLLAATFGKVLATSTDCLEYKFDGLRYLSLAEAALEAIRDFNQEKENAK